MRRSPWVWITAYLAATAVLVAGVVVLVQDQRGADATGRSAPKLADLAAMPFPSTVSLVGVPTAQVGQQVRFSAAGYSESPIERVDLFDGARRVASVPGPRAAASASLAMPALSVGQHLVHAQLVDEEGAVSKTAPVVVQVAPARGDQPVPVAVQPDDGETIAELAERLGVEPTSLVVEPPAEAPADPSPAGELPAPPPPLPADTPPQTEIPAGSIVTANVPPNAGAAIADGDAMAVIAPSPLDDDGLSVEVEATGCSGKVRLTAAGADGRISYHRTSAGVAGWVAVGSTEGPGSVDVATPAPGTHVFFVSSGTRRSSEVAVVVPPACGADLGWTGNASIVDGILTVPENVGTAYLYLSVGGQWQRVPASQDGFISAGTRTDVSSVLPVLTGQRLELQVWRVFGDGFTDLAASGELEVPTGRSMSDIVGEPNALTLSVDGTSGPAGGLSLGSEDRVLRFRWTAASPRVDEVIWQVLTRPLPPGNRDLLPDGLLATGTSDRTATAAAGGSGDFLLWTNEIPRRPGSTAPPTSVQPAGEATSGSGGITLLRPAATGAGITSLREQQFAATVALDAVAAGEVLQSTVDLPEPGDRVYVRILSVPDGTAVAAASTTVFVQLPVPQSIETSLDFRVDSLEVEAGRAPNPAYVQCLAVTTPWNGTLPGWGQGVAPGEPPKSSQQQHAEFASRFYPTSRTYCPSDFPPPEECDSIFCDVYDVVVDAAGIVVGVLVEVYAVVSHVYNGVIDGVVDIIATFNPVCLVLTAADDGAGKGCEAVAGIVARAAIGAVLASFGLPPSLPDVSQLQAIAEGNLAVLAKELMEQAGIPCDDLSAPAGFGDAVNAVGGELGAPPQSGAVLDDPCLAVAAMMIEALVDEVEAAAQETAAAAAGLPSFPGIEGFSMVPDPRGLSEPMVVTVRASLAQETADGTGAVCTVRAGNPDDLNAYRVGPFNRRTFLLQEEAPIDGRGRWVGAAVLGVNQAQPNPVGALQGAVFELGVATANPSPCQVPLTRTTVAVAPFDP